MSRIKRRNRINGRDVVKSLEYCINHDECGADCPCFSEKMDMCGDYNGLLKQCLDFIDHLKTERNKYRNVSQTQKGELTRLYKQVTEQNAEIEELNTLCDMQDKNMLEQKAEIERLQKEGLLINKTFMDFVNKRNFEAIKEFAGKLCEGRVLDDPVVIAIKTELKMMEEEFDNK